MPLMVHVGVPNFGMGDLIRPTGERVIAVLSGLINFTKFREEKLPAYEECLVQSEELMDGKYRLQQENKDLIQKINAIKFIHYLINLIINIRLMRVEEEPRAEGFRVANIKLQTELRDAKKLKDKTISALEAYKKQKEELVDRCVILLP